jgi:hypothetical protein
MTSPFRRIRLALLATQPIASSDAGDDTDVNDGETGNNTFQVNADDNPSFPARKRRRSDDASASRW